MLHKSAPIILYLTCFIFFAGCADDHIKTPKPRMFPRVTYPEKSFRQLDTLQCDFTFSIPSYCKIIRDTFIYEGRPVHQCWFDVNTPQLNASLYCSYYRITKDKSISALINDAFNIAGKHNIKANYRRETIIENKNGVKGILFDIEGPVASPVQFYLTDDKNHFFRASLYFNSKVNPDSTAPVLSFIKTDIDTLISTFRWK